MSRASFGSWGARLTQEAFAQAIAALGVLGPRAGAIDAAAIDGTVRTMQAAGGDIAVFRLLHLARLIERLEAGHEIPPAEDYRAAWDALRNRWYYGLPPAAPMLRLEVDPAIGPRLRNQAPGLSWLMPMLQAGGVADSAYLRVDEPDRAVAWEWPLRIGVFGDRRSIELGEQVESSPWPQLVRCVRLDRVDEDCDLLILPDDLRGAVVRVLQHARRPRADCVLVTGGAGVAFDRVPSLVRTLRSEVLTAGVGVVRVDPELQQRWFENLIRGLSHDAPLDVALLQSVTQAHEGGPPFLPWLAMSRRLATNARVTAFTKRLGQQVRRMSESEPPPASPGAAPPSAAPPAAAPPSPSPPAAAPPSPAPPSPAPARRLRSTARREPLEASPRAAELGSTADALESTARSGAYLSETGDASRIVVLREAAETAAGRPVSPPRDGAAAPPAAQRDERRVNFTIDDITDSAARVRVRDRLAADRAYEITLDIGRPREGVDTASARFPSERLPESDSGHWLDVSFVPLVRTESGRMHTPQRGRLWLPRTGDSGPCPITFRTHGVDREYRARILVSHENRVIQTLLFTAPLTAGERGFTLDVENLVSPDFDVGGHDRKFDAAIVVNHGSDAAQPGFTALVGEEVSFREPVGIHDLVAQVKTLLSAEATFPESRGSLDDPALLKLFDDLANYGRAILKPMPLQLLEAVPDGARIQVVEARSGAWLPVEIFHDLRPPKPGATMCPNARSALLREDGASHAACPHRDDRDRHCPLRFWGMSRVIERQPALRPIPGADYTISVPREGADRLDLFRSALIGASRNVRTKDLDDPGGIVERVQRVALVARKVADWDEWEDAIQHDSPSLLVLLPHSQQDPAHPEISALEIGGLLLSYPNLESSHVAGPAAQSPVVLLLGCSTQLTDVPFLNFVEGFKREKAALVIGTLATIRGRRAPAFVSGLLDGLKAAAGTERTFGDVFLETRRKLLADGDGFVLSLTAYGDVGWRI